MCDLKGFKDYLKENMCHRYITNNWSADDHESIARAFLIVKLCPAQENKDIWNDFYNFIISYSRSEESGRRTIWSKFLDKVALKYLRSLNIGEADILTIQDRVERERSLTSFINNKKEC